MIRHIKKKKLLQKTKYFKIEISDIIKTFPIDCLNPDIVEESVAQGTHNNGKKEKHLRPFQHFSWRQGCAC